MKTLRFLYGGSSIHWPPKPILSSPIFSHLFPFNFFPYIPISIFIFNIYFLHILLPTPYFFVIKKFLSSPIPHNSEKKFFYMSVQIPRILYHLPSINPIILSLNKYSQSRIILEILLQNLRPIYFPELLNHHLTISTYYVIIYYGNRNSLLFVGLRPIYWAEIWLI